MSIFDFIFGNESKKSESPQQPTNQLQQNTGCIDPVEQLVIESMKDLERHNPNLDTKILEAEAIYLAAFIYLKDSYQIDFDVDYFSNGLLSKINSEDYQVADKVFGYMVKQGKGLYGQSEANYGINGYKMNLQLCSDYGSYIKNYFIKAHRIGASSEYALFSSPRNCLWRDGVKSCDSPTQRDVYYKIEGSIFELMIPPFNPLVSGRIVSQTGNTIKCQSSDNKRTFVFHYEGEVSPMNLTLIEMYRNDKGDMVSYHKD